MYVLKMEIINQPLWYITMINMSKTYLNILVMSVSVKHHLLENSMTENKLNIHIDRNNNNNYYYSKI